VRLRVCELLGDQAQGLGAAVSAGDENGSLSGDDQQRGTVCGVGLGHVHLAELGRERVTRGGECGRRAVEQALVVGAGDDGRP